MGKEEGVLRKASLNDPLTSLPASTWSNTIFPFMHSQPLAPASTVSLNGVLLTSCVVSYDVFNTNFMVMMISNSKSLDL